VERVELLNEQLARPRLLRPEPPRR